MTIQNYTNGQQKLYTTITISFMDNFFAKMVDFFAEIFRIRAILLISVRPLNQWFWSGGTYYGRGKKKTEEKRKVPVLVHGYERQAEVFRGY